MILRRKLLRKRALALLVIAMMVWAAVPALAETEPQVIVRVWDGVTTADPRTGPIGADGTQAMPWIIDDPDELAGLAALVNEGTYSPNADGEPYPATGEVFVVATYTQTDAYPTYNPYDVAQLGQLVLDLGGYAWTPIGGAGPERNGVPYAPYFAGVLDGNNNSIINLQISAVGDPDDWPLYNSGYGLFGFVNGGAVANLALGSDNDNSGINLGDANGFTNVGAVAGYLYGHVINVTSYLDNVSAPHEDSSNIGGIVGGLDWKSVTNDIPGVDPLVYSSVRYTVNQAAVTGGSRVGGIVGGAYMTLPAGTAQNDQVLIKQGGNRGDVSTVRTSQRAYVGGIVGYNEGHILGSYNQGAIGSAGGNYIAGVAGILTDYNAPPTGIGSIERTYTSNDSFPPIADVPEQQALYASADNSDGPTITRAFWLEDVEQKGGDGWGTVVDSRGIARDEMAGLAPMPMPGPEQNIDEYMGADAETGLNYFVLVPGDYPEFTWRGTANFVNRTYGNGIPVPPAPSTDDQNAVFLDGRLATDGNGTQADPYNNWASAVTGVAGAGTKTIYIMGEVTVSSGTATFTLSEANVMRSDTWNGALFRVTGGEAIFGNIIIDGNKANMTGTSVALIDIRSGGSAALNTGTTLQNNLSGGGGGLRLLGGAWAEMRDGVLITDNEVLNYGGGVLVSGYSTFIMDGGTIEENLADIQGDAVDVTDNGTFSWYGGTLKVSADRFSSGISVTVNDPRATFEINQRQSASPSVVNGIIYLVENAYISASSTLADLTLTVECQAPDFDVVVARAVNSYTFTEDDVDAFIYYDGSYSFGTDDATIYLI
jgi:hypothetical protein